jgi:Putative Flp pilus-assembly TadE/G-like
MVLVALWLTVLMGFAAVAVDVGRFYSERRYLQNAADAAALAAANAMVQGRTTTDAELAARAVLAQNFTNDPTGKTPPMPSAVPIYAAGHTGEGAYLRDGILVTAGEVRVALKNPVNYTFGRALNLVTQEIGAQARASYRGGLLPIAVRRYVHPPGPSGGSAPCGDNQNVFMDFFATANTACLGTDTDGSLRTAPSAGAAFDAGNPGSDPTNHGPVVTILGQGAQPSNGVDFRGFVVLDIRNFATYTSRLYYNGVTAGTGQNTLKDFEAAWITKGGYPGPDLPAIAMPPDANDQIGIMSGNSSGIAVDAMLNRFVPGDEILVLVYPGIVMTIPDFAMTPPATVNLPATGTTASGGSFKVNRNQAFTGSVALTTLADTNDAANPMVLGTLVGTDPITYDPNPVFPSLGSGTSVTMRNITTAGAAPGIYALWVKAQAGSPYLTTKYEVIPLNVGGVVRDFTLTADATGKDAPSGSSVSFNLLLSNAPNRNVNFGGPVTLSMDPPDAGTGGVTFTPSSVSPSRDGTASTLTINTGTLSAGIHRFVVRATGMNGETVPKRVTHLMQLYVNVGGSGISGDDQYVDITGWAVMRVATASSNNIDAYAITPVATDPNDPILRQGRTARLIPWT